MYKRERLSQLSLSLSLTHSVVQKGHQSSRAITSSITVFPLLFIYIYFLLSKFPSFSLIRIFFPCLLYFLFFLVTLLFLLLFLLLHVLCWNGKIAWRDSQRIHKISLYLFLWFCIIIIVAHEYRIRIKTNKDTIFFYAIIFLWLQFLFYFFIFIFCWFERGMIYFSNLTALLSFHHFLLLL